MSYQHHLDKQIFPHALGKIVCVGRNYAEHAKELNNPVPSQPILFIKPATAAVDFSPQIAIPTRHGSCHHELEIAILIGKPLSNANESEVLDAISGIGLGLDLTLRDLQQQLKDKSHPWERAKSFDGACPLSEFIPFTKAMNLQNIDLRLEINQQVRQRGNSREMLFPIATLIAEISQWFTLNPGDVIMTGTPAGVAALQVGDQLIAELQDWLRIETNVIAKN
jgi:2-keto-4-pentenoate hydratase/2-oxohepta-3-ene-1,7-dioic acid hydratase in catechol pathway